MPTTAKTLAMSRPARVVLQGLDREVLESQVLDYRCRCSRESLREKLLPMAREDLSALVDESGRCEAVCAFCNARYVYSADELTTTH